MKKILAAFSVFIAACLLFTACRAEMPTEEIPVSADTSLSRTGVVYCTDGTYLIPITVQTPLGGDTPAELIACMQQTADEAHGLSSVLPADTSLSIVQDGTSANVSIIGDTENMDAEKIVCSVVNSLTQCGGIDSVSFSVNGLSEHFGDVDISEPITEYCMNPAYEIGNLEPFSVFYENSSGLLVPMTKATDDPCAEVYIKALMTVPKNAKDLKSLFPEGTECSSVVLTDGTLSVDFTEEFYAAAADPAAEERLLTAIDTTCRQLEGVEQVVISVNGVEYHSRESAVSVFANTVF